MPVREDIIKSVREAGIVGAGGAGFPAHVKYNAAVEYVIVNAAECEPLLRVDQQLIAMYPEKLIKGLELVCIATGAKKGIVAIKSKYKKAVISLEKVIKEREKTYDIDISLHFLQNFYPAGDEHLIVYEVTGRIVPEGGIPLEVGAVVNNVNTLINVCNGFEGSPVIDRPLTITGRVLKPLTLFLPVGTSIKEAIELAGGATVSPFSVILGGPMMGKITKDLTLPVTKTTSGIIVLEDDHKLVLKMTQKDKTILRSATEMCCTCRMCTDMCPRHMLGHDLRPHKVMRAIYFGTEKEYTPAFLCVECSVCEIACFMDLSPKRVFVEMKKELSKKGIKNPHRRRELTPHDMREDRKIPVKKIVSQLNLTELEDNAPFSEKPYYPQKVFIPLKQHIGSPAVPVVKVGDFVKRGDLIGEIPVNSLGARVHASISGTVTCIKENICIEGERL